ncbi:MAG TPA: excinuclease ABC subunit UvrC [Patescibacteria group bacterium]|nr:excinuclease ABC subunit UvrC [Patescibacteria group bacterium]
MNNVIKNKLAKLPKSPGVYFHKNAAGEIIYVGKAAVLNNRVRQYFQKSRLHDPKTDLLISEIADIDWIEVGSEAEALFLEAEMIQRYLPHYNILLRDDKSNVYIRINLKDFAPSVTITRRPIDDGAEYFGPFLAGGPVRKALRHLRKALPFSTHTTLPPRACLQYHLGLCPGPETAGYNRAEYIRNLRKLILYIHGKSNLVLRGIENEMKQAAAGQKFEAAALLRNRLRNLKRLQSQVIFGDSESIDLTKDHALAELTDLLGLQKPPHRIEGFDISHIQGTDTVASMVVFTNGVADKAQYRKFKMRLIGNDDFAHMHEVVKRRLQEKNTKKWTLPDLILIDGGRGQLAAAIKARDEMGIKTTMVGLAKRYEEIVIHKKQSNVNVSNLALKKLKAVKIGETEIFINLSLPDSSFIIKLLQRIRDESHRFAISYHTVLKIRRHSASVLDEIPGIGQATKKKLLRTFGSVKGLAQASDTELVSLIGQRRTSTLRLYIKDD